MRAPHSSWRGGLETQGRAHTRVDPPCDFQPHFNQNTVQERDWRQGQERRSIKKGNFVLSFFLRAESKIFFFICFSYWAFFFLRHRDNSSRGPRIPEDREAAPLGGSGLPKSPNLGKAWAAESWPARNCGDAAGNAALKKPNNM